MRHARFLRGALGVVLAGWLLGSLGCTHNYYYGNAVPACGPSVAVPATTANGAICEVPTQVTGGGQLVAQGQGRATIVQGAPIYAAPRSPRVVVSEPAGSPRSRRWQRSDPDAGLATTRVEGDYNDPTTNR